MVHHELDDDPGVLAEVLEADDPHDVGGILGVRLLAELVSQDQASRSLVESYLFFIGFSKCQLLFLLPFSHTLLQYLCLTLQMALLEFYSIPLFLPPP